MNRKRQPAAKNPEADHSYALAREILVRIGRQRKLVDAAACEELFRYIVRAQAIRRRLLASVSDHGLSEGQFCTLLVLHDRDPAPTTPTELAFHAGVTRATMTGVLDLMVERGWIERYRSGRDRREWLVKLEPTGRRMAERAIQAFMAAVAGVLQESGRDAAGARD